MRVFALVLTSVTELVQSLLVILIKRPWVGEVVEGGGWIKDQ